MAVVRKKKSSSRDNERSWLNDSMFSSLWWAGLIIMFTTVMISCLQSAAAAPITITNETMVVSQSMILGPCKDGSGSDVNDEGEWSTGCNRIVCHVEPSGNYTVTHGCRGLVPSENPDTTNCVVVENTSAAYPDCCPYLQCSTAPGLSTINPTLCYDISDNSTCQIWKDLSSNCTDTSAFVYNFSSIYCQSSCGFCSGGTG